MKLFDFMKKSKENKDILTGKERIAKKDLKDNEFYFKADSFTSGYGLTFRQIKKQKKLLEKNKGKVVLIKMEMANGQFREFLAVEDLGSFYFNKQQYVFDTSLKYFIIERNIWAYDFNEYLSIPIRKKFEISDKLEKILQPAIDDRLKKPINPHVDVNEIKNLIHDSNIVDVEASLNPNVLKNFTDSEVVKQVLQGAMLGKIFKIMFILIIVICIFDFLMLIINLYHSEIFSKIMSSFKR